MKLFILFLLSSFAMTSNIDGNFDSKKNYEYNVYLNVINLKLGEASFSVRKPSIINGLNTYHFTFKMHTNKLGDRIYKIRNKIDVWVDKKNLNVVRQDKEINEMHKQKKTETVILNQKGIVNGRSFVVENNVYDPYSLILILTEFDIPFNETKKFNIVDAGKSREIEIKNLGFSSFRTPYGKKQGYTLSPVKNNQRVLKNKGDMEITYVEINKALVPAKILIKLQGGVIELRLKKINE